MSGLNIMNRPHIMIDLETLSTRPNAVILSIGAVKFTFEDGMGEEFLINVDPVSCIQKGLHVDQETVEWWKKQPKEARDSWKVNPQPLDVALNSLVEFIGNDVKKQLLWCHGATFDFPIISSACDACGINWPTKYWNELCSRTVFTLLDIRNDKIRKTQEGNHTALADAKSQTQTLIEAFTS